MQTETIFITKFVQKRSSTDFSRTRIGQRGHLENRTRSAERRMRVPSRECQSHLDLNAGNKSCLHLNTTDFSNLWRQIKKNRR